MQNIRNFSIIAHIDHGKSTLADRFLELTGTIEKRKMREQVLDSMELERERGITIKMQPVRMLWHLEGPAQSEGQYELNLIDTPGHIDFSYEVSRALTAVEGAILLIDATQGVQAQTLSVLRMAKEQGLVIVPALSKIDSPLAEVEKARAQVSELLGVEEDSILLCSGKTGEGVGALLEAVIRRVPPPKSPVGESAEPQALIFDFQYSDHQGVIVYLRMFNGTVRKGDDLQFAASGKNFKALEVGTFSPAPMAREELKKGSIGYVVTGIKEPGFARVGDTIRMRGSRTAPLSGYAEPKPVVWASLYPESQDDFIALRHSLSRLRLSDSSLSFEEESSGMLGRGFRCGFLGMLHLEIITERLRREFNLTLVVTTPTVPFEVTTKDGKTKVIYSPSLFPPHGDITAVREPQVAVEVIVPSSYLGTTLPLMHEHEARVDSTVDFGEGRIIVRAVMPLRELMRNFFDKLKSVSQGYASISYEIGEMLPAEVSRLDILVADDIVPAFSRIVASHRAYEEAKLAVEKLYNILPRQQFATKIQGVAMSRILSSKTLPAMSKNVTQHMYGGDRTRKMKLWEKQKRGKAKLKERGKVSIPGKVFLQMVKGD